MYRAGVSYRYHSWLTPPFSFTRPNDPNSADALNSYHVETFLCDENNEKRDPSIPFAYGCEIRVCVKPTDDALQAGVRMKSIQNFAFQQTNTQQDITFTQVAIRNGESTNSAMTTIFCSAGWELCHFTTQLRSDFYIQPGTVILFGEAVLQVRYEEVRTMFLKENNR